MITITLPEGFIWLLSLLVVLYSIGIVLDVVKLVLQRKINKLENEVKR